MSKRKYYIFSIELAITFLFGVYLSSSYSNLAINLKYFFNKTFNNIHSKNISFANEPIEITLSLLSGNKDLNNIKFKKTLEKDSLTLSIINNKDSYKIKDLSDFNLDLTSESTYATNLKLGETPIILAKIDSNTIDKFFFTNVKTLTSYSKKNNCLTILYLDSTNSIPKNVLKYISSLGVDIILTPNSNELYLELIDNSLILYKNALLDENIIPQIKLVFFDNIYASIGIKFITNYINSDKITQKMEEINEKSINLPFFIKESYNFIDILQ